MVLAGLLIATACGPSAPEANHEADPTASSASSAGETAPAPAPTWPQESDTEAGPQVGWSGPTEVTESISCDHRVERGRAVSEVITEAQPGQTVCVGASRRAQEEVVVTTDGLLLIADGSVVLAGIVIEADDVTVRGFEVTHEESPDSSVAIYLAGESITVEDNYVHDTNAEGIVCDNAPETVCNQVVVANNTVHRNVGVSVEVWGSDVLVEGNDIRTPLYDPEGRDTDTLRVMAGANQVIRGNYLEVPNINAQSPDPHPDCLMMFDSAEPQFADWVINQIVVVEGNLCVNDADHNCFILSGREQGRSSQFIIRNNICDHAGSTGFFLEDLDGVVVANNLCTGRVVDNCIALVGGLSDVVVQNNLSASSATLVQVNQPDAVDWVDRTNLQADLTFLAPDHPNPWLRYEPVASSLVIDGGSVVDGPLTDILGNPRIQGDGIDIGPYESSP